MAVDLSELIPSLKRSVSAPGEEETTFPDATDTSWLGYLQDAFWETRLDGMLVGYVEADGEVQPKGSVELTRDLQQLIVLYAAIDIVVSQLRGLQTLFRAKAGPVEYETQRSATLLNAILAELKQRRDIVLLRLSDIGAVPSYYIDAIVERDINMTYGLVEFTGY